MTTYDPEDQAERRRSEVLGSWYSRCGIDREHACHSAGHAGARPGLRGRRSSSQHLIVGVHARSATRAQALPVVRQMKLER